MNKLILLILAILSINLTACNSIGNVVPEKGASMEQVYDDMGKMSHRHSSVKPVNVYGASTSPIKSDGFHQAPNPTLQLYVYPHLAGELPVPGYVTQFKAYEKDSWVL